MENECLAIKLGVSGLPTCDSVVITISILPVRNNKDRGNVIVGDACLLQLP